MARIVDTAEDFENYARRAALQSSVERELLWRQLYEGSRPEVFESFRAAPGVGEDRHALVRELSSLREQARRAAPVVRELVEEVEPAVADALGLPPDPAPVHVLLVGNASVNAVVGRLDGQVALFHCLEWFHSPEGTRVAVAHEDAHAWHQLALGATPPADDLAWTTFYEGLAVEVSRQVAPDRPDDEYFWYGYPGFEDWLPWCLDQREELRRLLAASFEDATAMERFFGAGEVDGHPRVGYFVAQDVLAGLGRPLPELVRMSVEEAREAVRVALPRH